MFLVMNCEQKLGVPAWVSVCPSPRLSGRKHRCPFVITAQTVCGSMAVLLGVQRPRHWGIVSSKQNRRRFH